MKTTLRNLATYDYIFKMLDLGFEPFPRSTSGDWTSIWPNHVRESVAECIDNTPDGSAGDRMINQLRVTPCAPGYLPLFVPRKLGWDDNVKRLFAISTQAFIAEFYVRLFELKRDHKEKPLYLFWNHDVPVPTPLTSLFWLLTCEAWPMPNHRLFAPEVDGWQVDGGITSIFPFQSIHMPQSTPLGNGGVQPTGFNLGRHATSIPSKSLNASFVTSLTREDRALMDDTRPNPLVARPRKTAFTHLDAHRGCGPRLQWWSDMFPWSPMTNIDSGYAAYEWQESHFHHQRVSELRTLVMDSLATSPGIPGSQGYANSFYDAPGLWIRAWSEQGIVQKGERSLRCSQWTPKGETIAFADGRPLNMVPGVTPRFWFGFTNAEIGEKYVAEPDGNGQKRVQSATEKWVEAYCNHREIALKMLFDSINVDLDSLIDNHLVSLEKRLRKAGRIKVAGAKASRIDEAFSAFLSQAPKPKE